MIKVVTQKTVRSSINRELNARKIQINTSKKYSTDINCEEEYYCFVNYLRALLDLHLIEKTEAEKYRDSLKEYIENEG